MTMHRPEPESTVPSSQAELNRRLVELCRATSPSDPSEDTWDAVLARVERQLTTARQPQSRPHRRLPTLSARGRTLSSLGVAAGLLVALLTQFPRETALPVNLTTFEPLPVVARADVEILSIAADDLPALVVGDSPLRDEQLVLATAEEIHGVYLVPEEHGADLWMPEGSAVPMLVAPVGAESKRDRE